MIKRNVGGSMNQRWEMNGESGREDNLRNGLRIEIM